MIPAGHGEPDPSLPAPEDTEDSDSGEDAGESSPVVYDVAADRDISVPEELSQNTWTVSGTLTAEDPEFLVRIISERTLNTVLSLAADRPVAVSVVPEAGGKPLPSNIRNPKRMSLNTGSKAIC